MDLTSKSSCLCLLHEEHSVVFPSREKDGDTETARYFPGSIGSQEKSENTGKTEQTSQLKCAE
jgi:hypothetical protein